MCVLKIFNLGILSLSLMISLGCTSLSRSQHSQYVHILPKSEKIVELNGSVLGQAPGYFEIPRERSPKIILRDGKNRQEVRLQTSYRWSSSFFSGLIFFGYAPLAWAVDLFTGTAWDVLDYSEPNARLPRTRAYRVAIAPPKAHSQEISDLGGELLSVHLKQQGSASLFPGYEGPPQVKSYWDTLPIFLNNDYVYDIHAADLGTSRNLYRQINADVIVESQIEKDDGKYIVESTVLNVVTGDKREGPRWELTQSELNRRIPGYETKSSWFSRLTPNTVGLDFVSERLEVELSSAGLPYVLQPVGNQDWLSRGFNYINSLNLFNSPDRRREFGSKWEFSAVPILRLSRKHVSTVDLPVPEGVFVESEPQFVRWLVTGGYGLEIGYLSRRHFTYIDIVPTFLWSHISWQQNGADRAIARTSVASQVELGYTYHWSFDWLIKFFTRSQTEHTDLWKDALAWRLGPRHYPVSASTIISGITVAYQFDSFTLAGWRLRK